jgi:hypothetical protein
MTTPRQRPAGSIGFADVARLQQAGVIRFDEAQRVLDLLRQRRDAGQEPFIQAEDIPRTGSFTRIREALGSIDIGTLAQSPLTPGSGLVNSVRALFGQGPLARTLTGRQVEQVLAPAVGAAAPVTPPAPTEPTVTSEEQAREIARQDTTTLPTIADLVPQTITDPNTGRSVTLWINPQTGERHTAEDLGFGGADTRRADLEFEAALRSGEAGAERAFQRDREFVRGLQSRAEQTRQLQAQEQLQARGELSNIEQQRRALTTQLLGQLFQISSDPASRLRFLSSQARGGSQLGQAAGAAGLDPAAFTELLNTTGLNPQTQDFRIEDQFASMFGLHPGAQVDFAAGPTSTSIVPNLGQLSGLTADEESELDALTEILFGQRLGQVQRKSRELAPPGGNLSNVSVR